MIVARGLFGLVVACALLDGAFADGTLFTDHDLHIRLEPRDGRLEATDDIRLAAGIEGVFRLSPAFTIDELIVDGRPSRFRREDSGWRVSPERRPEAEMRVRYRGTIPVPGEESRGTGPAAAVTGIYLPPWAGWYPVFDDNPITYVLGAEVPADYRAVSGGRLVSEEVTEGRSRVAFEARVPLDGITLVAGPYHVNERRHGEIRLRTYLHAEVADLSRRYLDKSAEYLDLYRDWIGPYPYPAFHVVSAPLPVGLGFPGFTYVGVRVLRLPFIPETSLGHEVLHNWWGNGVRVDAGRGNWSEGLTTFMADHHFAERAGAAKAREKRLAWLRDFAALPGERAIPLRRFTDTGHRGERVVGYGKAAMVFLMLRDEIGASAFDAGIRRFWREHRLGTASWADLTRAFEAASDRDLGPFFTQWLERPGAPRLTVRNLDVGRAATGYRVRFELKQEAPVYELSVPVVVETETGTRKHRMRLPGNNRTFTIETAARPSALAVDPDFELFRRLDPEELPPILRELMLSPEAGAVIATGNEDARSAAEVLARRLLSRNAPFEPSADRAPLLVAGTREAVADALVRLGLPSSPPEALASRYGLDVGGPRHQWAHRGGRGGRRRGGARGRRPQAPTLRRQELRGHRRDQDHRDRAMDRR